MAALFASAMSAASDIVFWATGEKLTTAAIVPAVLLVAASLAAIYISTLGIIGRKTSWAGYLRFAGISAAMLAPLGVVLTFAISTKADFTESARVLGLLLGLLISFFLVSLLSCWPIAQSLSAAFVSPVQIWRKTRGHRLSLITASLILNGLKRADFIPEIAKAQDVVSASVIAIANGLLNVVVLALTAAVAAAAWELQRETEAARLSE
ncbi:hypothetical protein ABDK56_04935 [Sphingomonas sp. ASV193]|uniref:hypothetical protein n=1 Tax=Sphingomonas sp. ASV193 TaxID=3144405 RepID=UPI0032E8513D